MKTYPLFKVHVNVEDALSRIRSVFESGFINEGEAVTELTNQLKEQLFGTQRLMLVNSCTSALTMALKLSGVDHESSVVSTPMTCVATNTPIVAAQAQIVWADVDPMNGMLTAKSVQDAIQPNTKAVIVVAWGGSPPPLDEIKKVCEANNVALILDAAHAFLATYRGVSIHEWADYTCYSFQAIKHFTTGDGGMLICNDREQFDRAKAMKWFGLDRDHAKDAKGGWRGQQWDIDIVEAGYKFNMNNLAAAVGLSQLPYVEQNVQAHCSNARLYDELFSGFGIVRPIRHVDAHGSVHWVYTMMTVPSVSRTDRDTLLHLLNAEGIMAGVVHVPNDDYTCFQQFKKNLPGVRYFSQHQFALPCGWWLNDDDIRYIARRVKELTQ